MLGNLTTSSKGIRGVEGSGSGGGSISNYKQISKLTSQILYFIACTVRERVDG